MGIISQFLWNRNLEIASIGGSGSGSFLRLSSRKWLRLQSSEGLMGAGRFLFKWLSSSHSLSSSLVVGRRPLFFATWSPPQGCLGFFNTWQLAFLRASDLREQGGSQNLLQLTSGSHTPSFYIIFINSELLCLAHSQREKN